MDGNTWNISYTSEIWAVNFVTSNKTSLDWPLPSLVKCKWYKCSLYSVILFIWHYMTFPWVNFSILFLPSNETNKKSSNIHSRTSESGLKNLTRTRLTLSVSQFALFAEVSFFQSKLYCLISEAKNGKPTEGKLTEGKPSKEKHQREKSSYEKRLWKARRICVARSVDGVFEEGWGGSKGPNKRYLQKSAFCYHLL